VAERRNPGRLDPTAGPDEDPDPTPEEVAEIEAFAEAGRHAPPETRAYVEKLLGPGGAEGVMRRIFGDRKGG
jgi:hypothetical protein